MSQLFDKVRSAAKRSLILAIESSCDDTCIAVLNAKNKIICEFKCSQKKLHQPFGGIVPQLASHGHRASFGKLLQNDLIRYIIKNNFVRFIAVTAGPGIGSCLNSGFEVAMLLARSYDIPLLPVNHLVTTYF